MVCMVCMVHFMTIADKYLKQKVSLEGLTKPLGKDINRKDMYFLIICIVIVPSIDCMGKDVLRVEGQYASSLFRRNQVLEGVPTLTLTNITTVSHCLITCLKHKSDCKSFNWGDGVCDLMSDSICSNETLLLTPKQGFSYYDLMDGPEFERKHLNDQYCRQFGKCSGRCYPRKPHYVDTAMTWDEAKKVCNGLGRALPQPHSFEENGFYAHFIKNLLETQPNIRNDKNMRYWFGLTDREVEGIWMYEDSTQVSDSFSAWALGQPDNGGPFAKTREDCGVVGEKGDFKWFDVNCNIKLKFFCA